MSRAALLLGLVLVVGAVPVFGQKAAKPSKEENANADVPYKLEFNPKEDLTKFNDAKGRLMLRVEFAVLPRKGVPLDPDKEYTIIIKEDGKVHEKIEMPRPKKQEELAVVLAMDVSGSMSEHRRMDQARRASDVFFKSLPASADTGLILFNHKPQVLVPPPGNREKMRREIETITPSGGTAYFDAALRAFDMLLPFASKSKALVLMTDGVDINSDAAIEQVIARAKKDKVRIYTVGIGEPGRLQQVTSVLVLDKSGSMTLPANDKDKLSKIDALKNAADKFVNTIGASRRSALLEFSDDVDVPAAFTNDKFDLKRKIKQIHARGETAFLDAVYAAVATLEAEDAPGKSAVVAMTDGIDNRSRRRVDEVVARALEAKVPLYVLGFGRDNELDSTTMKKMAEDTKGMFFRATNDQELMKHFENLSIKLHDDGIDEVSLQRLADETAGKYYSAKDVTQLDFILKKVTSNIQGSKHSVTFPSWRQVQDGLPRNVTLELASEGKTLVQKKGAAQTSGLVIAEMAPLPYLILLGTLAALIVLPGMFRKKTG
ncbi:MAG: VWA domain-containing protein [Planctomycetes bacterium]|nr:VWA domain-containing protein [Planctomycetota bacterium]